MTSIKKRNVVVEDHTFGRNTIKKHESNRRRTKETDDEAELETLLQEQRVKEKQLLQQWKEVRENEKKIRSIMRNQSRDIHARGRECFTINEGPHDMVSDAESHYIWKHDGCNNECKMDNCMSWLLESGLNCS
jgi:glutamate synthase domain-containing protein 2